MESAAAYERYYCPTGGLIEGRIELGLDVVETLEVYDRRTWVGSVEVVVVED